MNQVKVFLQHLNYIERARLSFLSNKLSITVPLPAQVVPEIIIKLLNYIYI